MASGAYIFFVFVFPVLFLVMFMYFASKFAYEEETDLEIERKQYESIQSRQKQQIVEGLLGDTPKPKKKTGAPADDY